MNIYRHKKKKAVQINITSLIDVMFMLLIFLVVSTTFSEQPSLKLELPKSRTAGSQTIKEHVIMVTKDGKLFMDDRKVQKDEMAGQLREIAKKNKDSQIILKADQYVPYGAIVELMDVVRESGLRRIVALTRLSQPE